ncbi:hypothetical protein ACIBG7_12635 [Nonomuraea sp. NPDC050328]|uniref:hypothetical protein n=1 Tax=Nonomuraea sp. NPDC050328 TaxID=3364361 RepID=UPI003797A39D
MSKAGYTVATVNPATQVTAPVALTANVARSVLGVQAPAAFGLELKKLRVGLYGISATAVPGDIEVCAATFATNPPVAGASTDMTAVVPQQVYGRPIPAGFLASMAWTAGKEPTVLSVIDTWPLTPNGGVVLYDLPLGDSPDCAPNTGFILRAKFPAAVSISACFWLERI